MKRIATCCCGACSLETEGEPSINGVCHCANCKRRTGSALGWSVYFASEQVRAIAGPLAGYAVSEGKGRRFFCSACGTTLYWTNEGHAALMGIAAGCFAPGALPDPDLTINNEGRCAWIGLPQGWRTSF